jgi:hypothetical protein
MAHCGVPEHLRSTMGLSSSLPAWSTGWKPRGSRRFASSPLLMKLEMADGRHEDTAQDPKPEPSPTSTQCKPIYDEFPAVEEENVLYQPF